MFLRGGRLLLGALVFGVYQEGVTARPQAPQGSHSLVKRQSIELSKQSSCNDVKNYQTQEGLKRIQADMFEKLEAKSVLEDYAAESENGVFTDYVNGFALRYGVGQTFHCLIGDGKECPRLNCADMDDPDAPGTGPAYAILLSFSNFNLYLNALLAGLGFAQTDWATLQTAFQQLYYPFVPQPIWIKELVNGLAAFTGMIGAASGIIGPATAAAVGSTSAILGGTLGGVNLAIAGVDKSLENLADIARNENAWYDAIFEAIEATNDDLMRKGYHESPDGRISLADLISQGEWVDNTDHPLLNDDESKETMSTGDLKDALHLYLSANLINYVWKVQGVYIIKYDMSEQEFNDMGNGWDTGYGDFRFRTYYGGSAFFLQRYEDAQDPLYGVPKSSYPPGWDSVGTDLQGCDARCIMQSTADGWHDYGFNYNFSTNAEVYSTDQATATGWLSTLPRARGFFNIPICDLMGHERVNSIDDLDYVLEDQKEEFDYGSKKAAFCYCKDLVDGNGKSFSDNYPQDMKDLFAKSQNCELGYW